MTGSCATCRRKSRRCGREKPACAACLVKGDECEGYPVRFCGLASRGRLSGKSYPVPKDSPPNKRRRVASPRHNDSHLDDTSHDTANAVAINASDRNHSRETCGSHHSGQGEAPYGSQDTPNSLFDVDGMHGSSPSEAAATHPNSNSQANSMAAHTSPTSISIRSRDDELLQPLDAVVGRAPNAAQTRLHGLHIYSPSAPLAGIAESPYAPPRVSSVRRLSWATRLAAVRLDALPSLSFRPDPSSLGPNLDQERVCFLLEYFDDTVCPRLVVTGPDAWSNPFRQYILPLTLQVSGVLYAVLGLSMGHFAINHCDTPENEQESLHYRLSAIRQVIQWLEELETDTGDPSLVEAGLAIILILVLHDVCETGVSADGVHLDGVTSICHRQSQMLKATLRDRPCMKFLLGALSWLHMLRCVSGDNKLMLPREIWAELHQSLSPRLFECFSGCPKDLFALFVHILELSRDPSVAKFADKSYFGEVTSIRQALLAWRPEANTADDEPGPQRRAHLANAFRHSFLLHSLRLVDRFSASSSSHIQAHVSEILDSAARVPVGTPSARRLLWPMFMAGTESIVPHQHDYMAMRIKEVRNDTGFRNLASTTILERIWKEKMQTPRELDGTWSWTHHLSTTDATKKHDYLVL